MLLVKPFSNHIVCILFVSLFLIGCGKEETAPQQQNNPPPDSEPVNDPEPAEFSFESNAYSVDEGQVVSITITRTNSSGQASISYGTNGISAFHGTDYNGFNPTELVFNDGQSSQTVNITTIDDAVEESTEVFNIELTLASNGYSIANNGTAVVTIMDNDTGTGTPPPPPPNSAPTISGTPQGTVVINNDYSFTPTVNDPEDDTLTFSVTNLPVWASFNESNGQISGMPNNTHIGLYTGIIISVRDNANPAVELASFSIEVLNTATLGSATLSWDAPTQKVDSSPLTDLAGYNIYYGTTPGIYPSVININNPGLTSYVVDNLPGGTTYHFVVTAIDAAGNESGFSNMSTKTLPF